jgi:cytochrome c oxidase assembly protein subunit 15
VPRLSRLTPGAYRQVTLIALAALAFIIVTGGAVRLTGSGLGCPQWPNCSAGHLTPHDSTSYHPAVEFINRVITGLVSLAVAVAVLGALVRIPRRRDLTVLSAGLVAGVVAQIVLGGETVRHRLDPGFVMAHFLLSMLIVWDAVVLHHRAGIPDGAVPEHAAQPELMWAGRAMAALAGLTVVLGTVVTGSGPHGGDDRVQRWTLDLHRVTQLHGTAAMLLVGLSAATVWRLHSGGAPPSVMERGRHALEALGFQVAIGYTQYFTGVPVLLVGFHILGAVAVWTTTLRLALALGSGPTRQPAAVEGVRASMRTGV